MPYNISTCKVKELNNFILDVGLIRAEHSMCFGDDAGLEIYQGVWDGRYRIPSDLVTICFFDGPELRGVCTGDKLMVVELDLYGEWSGTFYEEILKPVFEKSVGRLEAVLIWEGGDQIQRVKVVDGVLTEEEVDL